MGRVDNNINFALPLIGIFDVTYKILELVLVMKQDFLLIFPKSLGFLEDVLTLLPTLNSVAVFPQYS
jgi:hypothetical protein